MHRRFSLSLAVVVVIAVTACGDNGDAATSAAATAAPELAAATTVAPTTLPATTVASPGPITVTSDSGAIELAGPAERIAALSATHVEMLFALGAGAQVIAGDLFSDYPPEAARLPGLDSFNLSVESVIDLDPDLVVLSFDPGDAVAAFESVGIPTLLFSPAPTLGAAYAQMRTLGLAAGRADAAERVIAGISSDVDAIVDQVGDLGAGVTYYHETDPFSFYTPNSASFIGQLYALLGMENIADVAPDEFGSGYPQLSPEFIIESDPDVIFLGGGDGTTGDSISDRDGWSSMSAVIDDRVFVVDPDESSRWGPRVVDFLADIAAAVEQLPRVEP
jgi:iron complex transport system substrate-binding protein